MNRFELDRKVRENKILEITEKGKPVTSGIKLPIRSDERFNVYKIPVNLLIYNHLNDRFASKRKEYLYDTGKELTNDSLDSMKTIEKFIWESNVNSNKATLRDIAKNGQNKYGVITRDGRIVDGNRRATIIRKIFFAEEGEFPNVNKQDFMYFEAIVLPDDINDEEMITLETQIQMGEDEKVEYNAIEKYLKIDKLRKNGITYTDIANMITSMKNRNDVEKKHNTYLLMEEYLEYIDAPNRFSLIDRYEDHFLRIESILRANKEGKYNADWVPDDFDLERLKHVSFNYIRKGHEGKDFRHILGGPKDEKGLFSKREIWEKFINKHDSVTDHADKKIKHKLFKESSVSIKQRENLWKNEVKNGLDSALIKGKEAVTNRLSKDKPHDLIEGAYDKINLINVDDFVKHFDENRDKETYNLIKKIEENIANIKKRIINDAFKSKK